MSESRKLISTGRSGARKDQLKALSLSAVCMALIFAIQPSITRMRVGVPDAKGNRQGGLVLENNSAVAEMAVETPRLVLGGFRGVLAMYLWQEAEEDKNERRWEALGTKYNIIGKLEPYFDSVYIFHAWNLAYNLSAQWHDVANKYNWVLQGLDYLYLGESYNPDNPDLVSEEAQMYFMKIGDSFERIDYRRYWRDDIAHQYLITTPAGEPGSADPFESHRRMARYLAMPQFKVELLESPNDSSKKGYGVKIKLATRGSPVPDPDHPHVFGGLRRISEEDADRLERLQLQPTMKSDEKNPEWTNYLSGMETALAAQQAREKPDATIDFRYGLSVFYFAFVEYNRALSQSRLPSQTGVQVVDSRPAMSMRMWVRDDAYYATQRIREFAELPRDKKIPDFDDRVLEIRDIMRNIRLIAQPNAVEEFESHLKRFPQNENIHRKHIYETNFMAAIARAEGEMFEGLQLWRGPGDKPAMTPQAEQRLRHSLQLYKAAQGEVDKYVDRFYPLTVDAQGNVNKPQDRDDYIKYKINLGHRIDGVQDFLDAPNDAARKTDFLAWETIEK